MLRSARILPLLAVCVALVPAATASGATVTFTGAFEAERTVQWDQPRGVSQISCRGEHYYAGNGSETWKVRTRKPIRVTVARIRGGVTTWEFGSRAALRDPRYLGFEAAGLRTREYNRSQGTTGGWCAPAHAEQPPPDEDCGTRLPVYLVSLSGARGTVDWSMSPAPWMDRERIDFYRCLLIAPATLPAGSFPRLSAKIAKADLFNRRKKTIVISAAKSYGPESVPVSNLGVDRTTSGKVSWKLTLNRAK